MCGATGIFGVWVGQDCLTHTVAPDTARMAWSPNSRQQLKSGEVRPSGKYAGGQVSGLPWGKARENLVL